MPSFTKLNKNIELELANKLIYNEYVATELKKNNLILMLTLTI